MKVVIKGAEVKVQSHDFSQCRDKSGLLSRAVVEEAKAGGLKYLKTDPN